MKTLKLFTVIIKTEGITKVIENAKQKAWIQKLCGLIKMGEEARALLRREA